MPSASNLHSWAFPALYLRRRCYSTHSRLPARMPLLFRCFPLDSAVHVGLQPAAELRHLQRHKHERNVLRALRACPASSLHSWVLPTRCLCPARRPSSYASLSGRQGASAFNQPLSLDTSSVTNMQNMFYVRSTRALPAASTVAPSLSTARAAATPPVSRPRMPPSPEPRVQLGRTQTGCPTRTCS